MEPLKIILVARNDIFSKFLYNKISESYPIKYVILESPPSKVSFLKNRIRKIGLIKVIGQVLFQLVVKPYLSAFSKKRIETIVKQYELSSRAFPREAVTFVDSVNAQQTIDLLVKEQPDLVLVNGTRIISSKVLACTNAKWLNVHTGITPQYRGVHGGYWALARNDVAHCGVTVHMIDEGIDTGPVLYQTNINVQEGDNFFTYPYLQFGKGLLLLQKAIHDIHQGKIRILREEEGKSSQIWSHPTIWQYIFNKAK